jgi:hypothetical protein
MNIDTNRSDVSLTTAVTQQNRQAYFLEFDEDTYKYCTQSPIPERIPSYFFTICEEALQRTDAGSIKKLVPGVYWRLADIIVSEDVNIAVMVTAGYFCRKAILSDSVKKNLYRQTDISLVFIISACICITLKFYEDDLYDINLGMAKMTGLDLKDLNNHELFLISQSSIFDGLQSQEDFLKELNTPRTSLLVS